MTESVGDGRPEVRGQVEDAEATNQMARLRTVQQAWEQALERRTAAEDAPIRNQSANPQSLHRYYRIGVERFLMEIEALGRKSEADETWEEADLGEVVLPVPENVRETFYDDHTRILKSDGEPRPERIKLEGLESILDTSWPVARTWTIVVAGSNGYPTPIRGQSASEPPIDVLDDALRKARDFLADVGLDFRLGGDYKAISEEDRL